MSKTYTNAWKISLIEFVVSKFSAEWARNLFLKFLYVWYKKYKTWRNFQGKVLTESEILFLNIGIKFVSFKLGIY